ncbi:DEAD/DEAH box helicase [Bacillus sp. H-16]|uniref:DEAD/DEAH box helicase n=1 Tax=Alteribacter salitolerans TaxID=2912333 RepID=UPI0019645F1F|nr:type ISP restriction/modification enzyme [Alteribacter salitolerans]MBM7094788.1 DEAD/DEAH box helicase [Alteribacter salitolerans]
METKQRKSFIELLQEIDKIEREQRDRGTLFELLTVTYLTHEPMYSRLFDAIWTLNEVPEEYNIPKYDTGVDLVARKRSNGDLVAVQCKFYSESTTIRKEHVDSFLNEVGKTYYAEGLVVSSTDKWNRNAESALTERSKSISRIGLEDLKESKIDWSSFSFHDSAPVRLMEKKKPRPHQLPAIEAVVNGLKEHDRGKLIMAPGTGKTYTSMAIAEELAKEKEGTFRVLYLVPSIQLLSQTLRSWSADSNLLMDSIAVCSDRKVTKENKETGIGDISTADIGFPATTNYEKLLTYQQEIDEKEEKIEFLTVFSTYQSIDVITEAQKHDFYEFDLVVCDEAHRTTGIADDDNGDVSMFTKVHSNENIKASKRLYQTATPRIYGEDVRKKADEKSVLLADMNDSVIYGDEFYRIGFGDAIRQGILTDYKVMVLGVDEEMIARRFQQMLARERELEFDDVTKIIGCWNGLVKRKHDSNETLGDPMKRAIAFAGTIKESKLIADMFTNVVDQYTGNHYRLSGTFEVEVDHADGSMNALEKNKKISWLKEEVPENTCRILSNARFLTEGVDVPDLDAIMFLKPRKSKIDIAQAVGRVMRKSSGKDYGYIILPIGIPAGLEAHSILDNNDKYRVVWEVLNALRSLDERFDATINKLELNKKKPDQIEVIGVGDVPENGLNVEHGSDQLTLFSDEDLTDLEQAIYGKIVKKVGNVRYWEDWSKDVAEIARKHIMRINVMLEDKDSSIYSEFEKFVTSLRYNINDSISEQQAIEMLSQHLITKPIFEALFSSYSFVKNNPVSLAMESILEVLDKTGLMKEQGKLEGFYESVRVRAEGVDNLDAKQKIIIQLYDKFFKVGFKETTERLGIVFTPVEVVDFIIQSTEDIMKRHFNKSLKDKGVHILDPFTGTGTFIVRLLQSGLIPKEDLLRKYTQEIHANEIVLLSYYIAAVNIEETFHALNRGEYVPFEGNVLTDTFESTENKDSFVSELFNENNKRLIKQQENPIFAIIGNPPYSSGQNDANDNNKNQRYPKLEEAISKTYAKYSSAVAKNTLYDSYIKSFRWASDRINSKGIIAFVTNGSFIDSRGTDGLRKCWYEEFNYIYIFNLRGDQRTVGEKSRQEGGKIFGSGSRTPISITLLIKDGSNEHEIYYKDIGDYLTREQKLNIIKDKKSILNIDWVNIIPDSNNDWVNQRDEKYLSFRNVDGEVFSERAIGVGTKRDVWVYGFARESVIKNSHTLANHYNYELNRLSNILDPNDRVEAVNNDPKYIKWSRALLNKFKSNKKIILKDENVINSLYRPFTKKYLYYQRDIVDMPGKYINNFGSENKLIYITKGASIGNFSALVTDSIPAEVALGSSGTGFLLEIKDGEDTTLISTNSKYNLTDSFISELNISPEDAFYYVYAVLNSPDYKTKYANDLSKDLPKVPIVEHKKEYIECGQKLADLHLNYETLPIYPYVEVEYRTQNPSYRVQKMRHPKRNQLDTIIFNRDITIKNIPEKAYEYLVNGRPAIGWIIDQYQVKTDKKSGITDDPNDFSNDEKYIFNLLLRVINVAVQTVDLVNSLPTLERDE